MYNDFEKLLYQNSSGVDIDDMCEYSNERAIGYDGEYSLFKYLISNNTFPHSKLLTNLNIPVYNKVNKTTEIDLLLITPQGILVFEVKNYRGTIYGKDSDASWTQFFVSASNNKFNNPIRQNQYHIDNLCKLIPCTKYYSLIYFANRDCDISRISYDDDKCKVISQIDLDDTLDSIANQPTIFSNEDIDNLFNELKIYSNEKDNPEIYSVVQHKNLTEFKDELTNYFNSEIELIKHNSNNELNKVKHKYIRRLTILILLTIFIAIFFISFFSSVAKSANQQAELAIDAYNEMFDKFSEVSISDIELAQSLLDITNLSIQDHEYLVGSLVSFTITNNASNAYLHFNAVSKDKKAVIYVKLKDGTLQEYELANASYILPKSYSNFKFEIGACLKDIQWIKLSPVKVRINSKTTHRISIRVYESQD